MTDDKVWWSRERKLQGICDEVASVRSGRGTVLALAHFESTLASLQAELGLRSIRYHSFSMFDSTAVCAGRPELTGEVWAGLAQAFQSPSAFVPTRSSESYVEIIAAEHHPLRSRDEQLIQLVAGIPCRTQVSFHISLDDPLIVHFSGNSIQKLFKQLGASEVDLLSNPMVTRAIRQAQEKIEGQVPRDLPAQSIDDWFKYNLPKK